MIDVIIICIDIILLISNSMLFINENADNKKIYFLIESNVASVWI